MRGELNLAASHLIRDLGEPIRTFSGASIKGHPIWIAVYHGHTSSCKVFDNGDEVCRALEALARIWGPNLEYPFPNTTEAKGKGEELHLNGCPVVTSIKVLDGCGYYFAIRFPEEVPNWKARKIVNEIGEGLIEEARGAYNNKPKR